jgi:hypothetical protein
MAYVIYKYFKTPARYAVDGKDHRRIQYYAGRDTFGGFGIDMWNKRGKAKVYDDYRTAIRYASCLDAKVKEVSK